MRKELNLTELRVQVKDLIEQGKHAQACRMLSQRALSNVAFHEYPWLANELANCVSEPIIYRIGFLSSFTLEPIKDVLLAIAFAQEFCLELYFGGFQQLEQEMMVQESGLANHKPNAIIIAWRLQDISPSLWNSILDMTKTEMEVEKENILNRVKGLIQAHQTNFPDSQLLLHTFVPPIHPALGIIDFEHPRGQQQVVTSLNTSLRKLATASEAVHLVDCDTVAAQSGSDWFNARRWYTARAPLGPTALLNLAREYFKYVRALAGKSKKVLVTDLDNTLWGGILGEDGLEGIELGANYPGNAYVAFQQEIKQLSRRGVVIAVCSKNNEADVRKLLEEHSDMVLKWEDFAAVRINWQDKSTNLCELADELSLGLDSFVFIDDNPYELEIIQHSLPEVSTVQVPREPAELPGLLSTLGLFDTTIHSEEDRKRGEFYRGQVKRAQLKHVAKDLESFYLSLSMAVTVYDVGQAEIPRVAQLTQRTNQFNISTRRYTETDIQRFRDNPTYVVRAYRLEDRFGDNGIISVVIVQRQNDVWYLDTFLMSCRVIGRKVETAILALIVQEAKLNQATALLGEFIPTKKNVPAKDVFARHGFEKVQENTHFTKWKLLLDDADIKVPEFFQLIDETKQT